MGKEKITVTALTSGANDASTRFRIRQYTSALSDLGVKIHEFCPFIDKNVQLPQSLASMNRLARSPFAGALLSLKLLSRLPGLVHSYATDIVWINRQLLPGRSTFESATAGPRVFDVDDAIWIGGPQYSGSLCKTLKNIDVVFAGNIFLADWLSKHTGNIHIIPTGVDEDRFFPAESEISDDFVVGWTGSRHTIHYLYQIEDALQCFLNLYSNAKLLVVSDLEPTFSRLSKDRIRFVQWSPAIEASVIRQMSVGIMPLPDDDWARGKCSFKMLQYMATGLPVVVSPVGMNKEVLDLSDIGFGAKSETDWIEALSVLYTDRDLGRRQGANGRLVINEHYSLRRVAAQIATIFKGLV